ncbi:LuxR C-terminal-related transcriptional regulator, partial [Eggerthella sinensis]|uniref:helix-turn-helix transcriptional regulator n=1 Tax=Eggerthella sinensis TaxID=242230 RepID=UPI0022E2F5C2
PTGTSRRGRARCSCCRARCSCCWRAGASLSIVMRDLQIAKGTAQTHIENVYAKLGVHKQQELIDLVEAYG